MNIDLILTFDKASQERFNFPFVMPILKDKATLIDFVVAKLNDDDKRDIIKISCCLEWFTEYEKNLKVPKWYHQCNGKIWVDDLERWKQVRGIKSTVSPEYIKEFMDANPQTN